MAMEYIRKLMLMMMYWAILFLVEVLVNDSLPLHLFMLLQFQSHFLIPPNLITYLNHFMFALDIGLKVVNDPIYYVLSGILATALRSMRWIMTNQCYQKAESAAEDCFEKLESVWDYPDHGKFYIDGMSCT